MGGSNPDFLMSRNFEKRRLDAARVMPDAFLAEFCNKDAGTRRFLLNALTLFATVSAEQQHQAINDLIQTEISILADRSQTFLKRRVQENLKRFQIEKELNEDEIREYYYRYYMITGLIPERLTPDYLNVLLRFIIGVEIIKMMFSMSCMAQQRFFELQGKYSTQAMLFYRYIKPIRAKLFHEKVLNRDTSGNYYYLSPKLEAYEVMDFIFDIFNLEQILYLGDYADKLSFESDYIYHGPDDSASSNDPDTDP